MNNLLSPTIVKNLIELHGGTFDLRSELRKGTEGIITLPPKRVLASLPPLQPLGAERHRHNSGHSPVPQRATRQPRLRSAQIRGGQPVEETRARM